MSVFKRTGRKTYTYKFEIAGRVYRGNTKAATKREAERVEAQLKAEAQQLISKGFTDDPTLETVLVTYYQEVAEDDKVLQHITTISNLIGADTPLSKVNTALVSDFVQTRRAQKNQNYKDQAKAPFVAHSTINRELQTMRAAINRWCDIHDVDGLFIRWGKVRLKEPDAQSHIYSSEEIERIRAVLVPHAVPLIDMLLETGQRLNTIKNMQWEQVRFDLGFIEFNVKSKRFEGGRKIYSPMTSKVRQLLQAQHPEDKGAVYKYGNVPCPCPTCLNRAGETLGNIKTAWTKAKAKAGITKKARLHDIRHTAGTRILKESKDITKVQAALGHADLRSTERYAKVDFEELRAAMERMNKSR